MDKFVRGDIVVINFPFSDLSGSKRRPALVLSDLEGDDIILCQITSRSKTDKYSIQIEMADFIDGKLTVESVIRPNKIFTADKNIILYTVCKISSEKFDIVVQSIINIMSIPILNGEKLIKKGTIILLNGVSSAGKSTLAKTLQERLSHPYFHMDVDTFCLMSPEKFNLDNYSIQHNFVSNMFLAIKLFSDIGFNLIVPCVFLEDSGAGGSETFNFLEKCVNLLHTYPVLFVHVKCPVEELRHREKKRGDRKTGEAEAMLPMLIPQDTYDITVDTFYNSTEECADKIIDLLNYPEKLTALKSLWQQRTK